MSTRGSDRAGRTGRRLTAEYVAARALAESETFDDAAVRVLKAICETLDWDFGALWNVDPEVECLRCFATWGLPNAQVSGFEAASRRMTFSRGIGLPGRVWERGKSAWIADVVIDHNFPRGVIAGRDGLHGAFALPILSESNVIGVVEFFSREIRQPDEELLRAMADVGVQIGRFIERKRAEGELDRFFNLAPDLMCIAGFDGYFKRLNPAWERTLGYSPDELLAQPYIDFIHPDDRSPTTAAAARVHDGLPVMAFENRYRHRNGSYRWLEWAAVPHPGEPLAYAVARDITDRKEGRESPARYSRDLAAALQAHAEDAARLSQLVGELEVRNFVQGTPNSVEAFETGEAIEVLSAQPRWVELLVPFTREGVDEISTVFERLGEDLPNDVVESLSAAFRELLLSAVECVGQPDPNRKIRIACQRADRMLMYRVADPAHRFTFDNLVHRDSGFGTLVKANFDELIHNEKHSEVILIKYVDPFRGR